VTSTPRVLTSHCLATYDDIKQRASEGDPALAEKRTRWFLLGSVAITAALYLVPYGIYINLPLIWLSTLAHELGHGFTAALLGGEFDRFVMHADASGVAQWSAPASFGPIRQAMVAAGGLVGPAIFAAVGFVLARNSKAAKVSLLAGTFLLVAIAVLVVRNGFGLAFVGTLALIVGVLATRERPEVAQLGLVFMATQLAMSVFSRGDYLFMEYAETASGKMPSDVSQMADALVGPYWFWGAMCGLFSLTVLGIGLWVFFKGTAGLSFWSRSSRA
jgi:hypothetical protein